MPGFDPSTLLWVVAALLVLIGLAGTLLPFLPGVVLVAGGLIVAAWAGGFQQVGWFSLTIIALLAVLAYVLDFVAGAFGAKRLGASRRAFWGALAGAVAGLFFGLPGVLLGPFVGAVAAEYTRGRELRKAGQVGLGTWLGMVVGAVAKVALAVAMLGVFAVAYFF